jgi:hypothetical protein
MLSTVGTVMGGLIGWSNEEGTGADPEAVRRLFADIGIIVPDGAADLADEVRRFQRHVDLRPDGIAGPRTVHLLARYAEEARDLREIRQLAA